MNDADYCIKQIVAVANSLSGSGAILHLIQFGTVGKKKQTNEMVYSGKS
jgi:hypothetical protein